MKIVKARSDAEILNCFTVLKELRPNLNKATFVADVRRMAKENYQLAFLTDSEIKAVAGYRTFETFFRKKVMYVDDLVVAANSRSQGFGKLLINWLSVEARKLECLYLELDSGVQRLDAHRFYKDNGFEQVVLHFSKAVKENKL